jgi:hypothetical protein
MRRTTTPQPIRNNRDEGWRLAVISVRVRDAYAESGAGPGRKSRFEAEAVPAGAEHTPAATAAGESEAAAESALNPLHVPPVIAAVAVPPVLFRVTVNEKNPLHSTGFGMPQRAQLAIDPEGVGVLRDGRQTVYFRYAEILRWGHSALAVQLVVNRIDGVHLRNGHNGDSNPNEVLKFNTEVRNRASSRHPRTTAARPYLFLWQVGEDIIALIMRHVQTIMDERARHSSAVDAEPRAATRSEARVTCHR